MEGLARTGDLERTRQERDLYRRLLDLGASTDLESFLRQALALVVELAGARQGYIELRTDQDAPGQPTGDWRLAYALSEAEIETIHATVSRGIIAEAMATGQTIATHSALLDGRFRERESVKRQKIQAVLCAPVGTGATLGVVYLQDRLEDGGFPDQDRANVELFARHLAPLADRLLVRRRLADARDATRDLRERYRLDGIVGRSASLAAAMQQAMLAAPLDVNVLLTGDSGTGKSQLARAIHVNSHRARGPFVEINCAALPESLIESELFGARAGSHSEARSDIEGKVAVADGGTLFLDEVSDIPFEAQPKLLQLLQSRRYFPLGASHPVEADVRLIAASNTDLEAIVREKRFREDLFFRLQVLPIRLPSLCERREDLRSLAEALCLRVRERHRLGPLELSPGALRAIEAAEWPGNIRQLENAVEAAAIRAAGLGDDRIEARHVFAEKVEAADERPLTFQEETRRFQSQVLKRTLEDAEWNVAEAARRLDLARSHVYKLIQAFGLARE